MTTERYRHAVIRNCTDEERAHPRFREYVDYVCSRANSIQNAMTFTYWLRKPEDWTRRLLALPPSAQTKVCRGQWDLDRAERWRDS